MVEDTSPWLARFPVTLFTTVMGLSGLTLALAEGERVLSLAHGMSILSALITVVVFMLVTAAYALKALRYTGAVQAEWNHPVSLAFFPAISISLLLLAAVALPWSEPISRGIWIIGAALQLVLTLAVISSWIGSRAFVHGHLTPAWFVPAVGNVIAPLAGAQLGYIEISWFFLSIGLLFWIVLLAMVINRLVFHDPLPERLQPTLVILIAPPAIGFLGWTSLNPGLDPMARILMNSALFFLIVVMVQLPTILRLPFSLSFWALSFPLAAATTASLRFSTLSGSMFHHWLGLVLLGILTLTLLVLLYKTLKSLASGHAF
ncbi:SLAC1 anion channel family protein [Roseovarius rhodophyticola]|uniref:SLAC1 anion channel family protein n=1 Tax=Roseovarius rhodophyticola TaxID=3080827 RepID=A0ABZ2TB21_9RHOB|nr:SLAC1 anion channel family protein [Roseovarius sp. W115]MDV2930620.1 SLAC1 anion channel family protein [Roseovarius sp. W115]